MSRRPLEIVKSRPESSGASRVTIRILCGLFAADIIRDPHTEPPIWHVIVQIAGSPEIIYWGQELSFENAEMAAEEQLAELTARTRQKNARAGH